MPSTATVTRVPVQTSAVPLVAPNDARQQVIVMNDAAVTLYVKFGDNAAPNDFTYKLVAQQTLELPMLVGGVTPGANPHGKITGYTGIITGAWAGPDGGGAQVTELSGG